MEELAMLLGEDAAEDAAKDIAEPGEGADNEDFLALPRQQLEELNQLYQSLWRESRRGSSRWGF